MIRRTICSFIHFGWSIVGFKSRLILGPFSQNAAYLAEKQGLAVIDAVLDALSKAGNNNQTAKKIMVTSSESAVLNKFKNSRNYELVYVVDEDIRDVTNSTILEIKKFASSVVITKKSVFPIDKAFLTLQTDVVSKFQAFGFHVYVQKFRNEFLSQPWDFFSDAYVEINTHVSFMKINGVITDFPATAAKYKSKFISKLVYLFHCSFVQSVVLSV